MRRAREVIELPCPGRPHAPAGEEVGRFLGRQRLDLAPLLTTIAGGLCRGRARNRYDQQQP